MRWREKAVDGIGGEGLTRIKRYSRKGLLERTRLAFRSVLFEVDEGRGKERGAREMAEPLQHLLMRLQDDWRSEAARLGGEGRQRGAGKMKWKECREEDQWHQQCCPRVCVCVSGGGNSHLVAG